MRVEAVGEIPKRVGGAGAIAREAAAGLAIKNFLAAIESDDSLFCTAEPLNGPSAEDSSRGHVCSGEIFLEFRQAELKRQRGLHFLLMEKLIELLKEAGSQETLAVTLCLAPGKQEPSGQKEIALGMRLAAKGDSLEQAVLRWGLGLAHVQQAVLFTSRYMRLHLGQTGE
jgi:hypothetical protein